MPKKCNDLCQVQDGGCDCREALLHWDSARTFRQSDSRKDGIPVEHLLVISCQVTYYRKKESTIVLRELKN